MENIPRWISEQEVSRITGLALPTLRAHRWKKIGVPYARLGRTIRYSMADVIGYMEQNTVQTGGVN